MCEGKVVHRDYDMKEYADIAYQKKYIGTKPQTIAQGGGRCRIGLAINVQKRERSPLKSHMALRTMYHVCVYYKETTTKKFPFVLLLLVNTLFNCTLVVMCEGEY